MDRGPFFVGTPHAAPVSLLAVQAFRANRAPNEAAWHLFLPINNWLDDFLWHWRLSAVSERDAAEAITGVFSCCQQFSEQVCSHPLQEPEALFSSLETPIGQGQLLATHDPLD